MKTLIILMGNIGSGKSTISKKFADQGFKVVNADSYRTMMGAGNYLFDYKIEPIIHEQTRNLTKRLIDHSQDVVVDETMGKRKHRKDYIEMAKSEGYLVIGLVMPNWGKDVQVDRRMASEPRGYERKSWEDVWDKIDKAYEEPTKDEGFDLIINLRG